MGRLFSGTDQLRYLLLAALGGAAFSSACGGATGAAPQSSGGTASGGEDSAGADSGGDSAGGVGGGGSSAACEQATPWPSSADTTGGFVKCGDGVIRRSTAAVCAKAATAGEPAVPNAGGASAAAGVVGECQEDADCTELTGGFCQIREGFDSEPGSSVCAYPCTSDDDCSSDRACACEPEGGRCIPATCRVDADCGDQACVRLPTSKICGNLVAPALSCAPSTEGCAADSQCETGYVCVAGECALGSNSCGRPFLVGGVERRAAAEARGDWCHAVASTAEGALLPEQRARVSEYWTQAALMEHASIAAFARFALELLALGAPAELVARTSRAMADETEHARLCFGLAGRYGGEHVGPGPLSVGGCLDNADLVAILSTAFREACIGETVAALEAREAAERAIDPVVRATLARIAEDEASHAELGWRFVAWVLQSSPASRRVELIRALGAITAEELTRSPEGAPVGLGATLSLESHGVLSAFTRAVVRQSALLDVIVPCLSHLEMDGAEARPVTSPLSPA